MREEPAAQLIGDLPAGAQQSCDEAGVMGPVVGFAGALAADLALRILADAEPPFGLLHAYDGKTDRLRQVEVAARAACPLCGPRHEIVEVIKERYISRICAA